MIADMLEGRGTVTGVDVAEARLGACRNVLAKYNIPNVRLILHDGTTVDVHAPPKASDESAMPTVETNAGPTLVDQGQRTGNVGDDEEQEASGDRKDKEESGRQQQRQNLPGSKKRDHAELAAARWRKKTKRNRTLPNELPNVFYAYPHELCLASASTQLYDRVRTTRSVRTKRNQKLPA
jgi:hypothetical protein